MMHLMQRYVLVMIVLSTVVAGGVYVGGVRTEAQLIANNAAIVLTETGFVPDEVRIRRGGTVTFSTSRDKPFWPASNSHPNHGIYPAFDPLKPIPPGETWAFTFEKAGAWGFHDHVRSYYVGTINVVE